MMQRTYGDKSLSVITFQPCGCSLQSPGVPPNRPQSWQHCGNAPLARMNDRTLRVIDLTDPSTREAITEAEDIHALYLGGEATDY